MLRNVKQYLRPTTIEEAVTLAQTNPHACYLGGGAWVVAQGDPQLETVVDLQGLGLDKIESDVEGVRLGARVTLQQLLEEAAVSELADGLANWQMGCWRRRRTTPNRTRCVNRARSAGR